MTVAEPSEELTAIIRSLLLPVSDGCLEAATEAAAQVLNHDSVPVSQHVATLQREWLGWTMEGTQSTQLKRLVREILTAETSLPARFISDYFKCYDKLCKDRYLPAAQARSLLGNTLLIQDLLREKKMSCTQIARVLSVTQSDHEFNWAMVQPIARVLGLLPQLDAAACNDVYDHDARLEEERFVDASAAQAIDVVADVGDALGYEGSLYNDLAQFYADYKPGYGIMLHMGCLVSQFYDHPPKEAPYEFQPRGGIAKDLAERFHKGYEASESPYLNNAKGAANLDTAWAWARQPGYIGSALGFAAILDRLGSMPYPARKQLAPWIRQWLHRISREREATFVPVREAGAPQIRSFLDRVTAGNTRTRGVLDQRVVDLLSVALHPGWDQRGVGDFVNASNVRKRKTGDIEFMDPHNGIIIAYEAHGGSLANVYVDLHRQTLRQVLLRRRDELILGRAPSEWSITIRFIAHDLGNTREHEEDIEGFPVRWEFQTYKDFVQLTEEAVGFEALASEFNRFVVHPINATFVPEQVRQRFRDMAWD